MPASVKVKVFAARNLPVMDRTSFLTDAFVEVRLGNTMFKTEVIRRTLNPEWNSDWFYFELSEEAILEEALQIRVLDHDTYSSHDTIGRVYFDLTPLLQAENRRNLSGWFPLYDTMHGVRGEIKLAVRVDLFPDAYKHRFSSLGVRFFFSSCIPSGYRVLNLIGFVRELIMNDDPEHQWIEKIRTSRASNEARQGLFSQLSGELQRKLGRKVLNLGGNAVVGYRLHFDLEGDTGIVARAIGTAARLQRLPTENSRQASSMKKAVEGGARESRSEAPSVDENVTRRQSDISTCKYAISSPKPLGDAEFPFLTITHPPRGLIRHFGSAISAKSVKLLDKNVTESTNSRAAWWLELRTEALTRMYAVGCDALLGYREDCAIYEDVCVLSVSATAVILNQLWVHAPPDTPLPHLLPPPPVGPRRLSRQDSSSGVAALIQAVRELGNIDLTNTHSGLPLPKGDKDESSPPNQGHDCSLCHIPSLNQALPPNKTMHCRLCQGAFVPEFLLSTTDFPPELPNVGRPAFIQVGLSRSKKEEKGESAAREISELLPYMEYEMHYRLLIKLRLRGMNAIFGMSFQLAIGEDVVAMLATGTGVYISSMPAPHLPTVNCVNEETGVANSGILFNTKMFNEKCSDLYGIPNDNTKQAANENQRWFFKADIATTNHLETSVPKGGARSPFKEPEYLEHPGTYFVDAREPEPEELNSLATDPLPPSALMVMTTDCLPNSESLTWLAEQRLEQNEGASPWRGVYSFVKIHTIHNISTEETLGSMVLRSSGSVPVFGDVCNSGVSPIPPSTSSLDSNLNECLVQKSMAKCLRDCNRLTWFHFRGLLPCAITSLAYRLTISGNKDVQILCSGATICLTNEELTTTAGTKNAFLAVPSKFDGGKSSTVASSHTRKSIFNRQKGFRSSGSAIELKSIEQGGAYGSPFAQQQKGSTKKTPRKSRWWKSVVARVPTANKKCSKSSQFYDSQIDIMTGGSNASDAERCILTPTPNVPYCRIAHYIGTYSFYFVRETNDLREIGGLKSFIHATVGEAQAVAAAHTLGLGGNALVSYRIGEVIIDRSTSRNQAQCLINICGDMVQTM